MAPMKTCYTTLKKGITAVVCSGLMVAACNAANTIKPDQLTIGADLTYPPYDYHGTERPEGFDPDFMRLIAKEMKLTPVFKDTRFANLILGVNAHRFDVIASALYVTPARAKQVDFIGYFKTGASILAKQGSAFQPAEPKELCGKKVASIKGASWIPKLDRLSEQYCAKNGLSPIENREYPTAPEAAQAVLANAVDVQMEDAAVAKSMSDKLHGRLVISSTSISYPVVVGLAVTKQNQALKAQLEQAFANIQANGEYQQLLTTYNLQQPTEQEVSEALGTAK